jgi:hypothetical protein
VSEDGEDDDYAEDEHVVSFLVCGLAILVFRISLVEVVGVVRRKPIDFAIQVLHAYPCVVIAPRVFFDCVGCPLGFIVILWPRMLALAVAAHG